MDEQPVRLVKETRESPPTTGNHPQRVHYECELAGTAAVFMFCEPPGGWRQARARNRRTKTDWALEETGLPEGRYPGCGKVTLVLAASSRPPIQESFCDGTPVRRPTGAPSRADCAPSR